MPTLTISRTYASGQVLTQADLDNICDDVEQIINTTGLDSANIQAGGIATTNLADGAVTAQKIAADAVTTTAILDGNVTIAKLSSKPVLAYNTTTGLKAVRGTVNSSGTTIVYGEGFTYSWSGTQCTIVFTSAFATEPTVVCSTYGTNLTICQNYSVSTTQCVVQTGTNGGALQANAFSFIAIGPA